MDDRTTRDGLLFGVGAYLIWGLLPLYLKLLAGVSATEVLAHRVVWSLLLLGTAIVVLGRVTSVRAAATGRTLLLLSGSAALIGVNWSVYIWAVLHGHVLEASLGYFINPLVNVALGLAVLGERIRPMQKAAVGVALAGVLLLAAASLWSGAGGAWWVSISLALTFGLYGLIRKVAAIDALGGLFVETLVLFVPSAGWLLYLATRGEGAFGANGSTDLLLMFAGAVTALPLLLFAAAARRLRYATMGLLQYIAPTLQFIEAVVLFGEPLQPLQLATFALIWAGCALYAVDSLREARGARRSTAGR